MELEEESEEEMGESEKCVYDCTAMHYYYR